MDPKISVVMSVYNGEKYLKDAIESVLKQTYNDFEFIIIDDASTDSSADIIKSYNDLRIRFIQNKHNLMIPRSINNGINISRGEYIARMDADDICFKKRFEEQVKLMDANPQVGLCSSNAIIINANNDIIAGPIWVENHLPAEWEMIWSNPLVQPASMIRKNVLLENDLWYDLSHRDEDYNLWCRIILVSKAVRMDQVLLKYRRYKGSGYNTFMETCLTDSLESNKTFIKTLTKKEPPFFHADFTEFKKVLGTEITHCYDLKLIKKWFALLIDSSKDKWEWDQEVVNLIIKDANRKILNYINSYPINKVERMKLMLSNVKLEIVLNFMFRKMLDRFS